MPKIKAFAGYLVNAARAKQVVSPAYDSVSPQQRRQFAEANPQNFLNTMRLLEDFPADARPTQSQLLSSNKANLDKLLDDGSYEKLKTPCLFVYQLGSGAHVQTGVVCEIGIEEYEKGLVRKHENTRSDKEDLLTRYQKVVGVSSSPICLAYSQSDAIDDYVARLIEKPDDLEFISEDGAEQVVKQRVWRIENSVEQQKLIALFSKIEVTYLTDGHHRAASGYRYAEMMREQHNNRGGNHGDEPYNQLLVALFPDNQLNLLPFHRCVKDLNGLDETQIVAALRACFAVKKLRGQTAFDASQHGEFGMYINQNWYRLNVLPQCIEQTDPVNSLDVTLLQNLILEPIFGIKDMRGDARLDYIAGVSGDAGIKQKCSEGWKVVFACYATSIEQLMKVADADLLMPPKSTYFDPKPRSGIFVRLK
ncbi:DUF1015 domain-containing protein [Candidatus Spongiihabitans sp.]|uniref:DUF1015 domain-containing protein n=1 Tax=Candidatus Spongiihabitans sp. TaxID=3101308 RepID=UPI003C7AC995